MVLQHKLDEIIINALEEDMNYGDITTDTLISDDQKSNAILIAKDSGIIAGCEVFSRVFYLMDKEVVIDFHRKDGDLLEQKDIIAHIFGPTKSILKCERTALNIIQKLSGIATMTNSFVNNTNNMPVRIVDTRKTTPGLRALEKYAVRVGGGYNHRFNLSDAVMIKDNHIKAVGSIKKAVEIAKAKIPHTMKVEIEVENLDGLKEALNAEADIIMLDNMTIDMMKEAVSIAKGKALLEASGNVDLDRVKEIAETGVDIISVGALTHSVKAMDISMKFC
ncbi:carboxylating nicotinate-nucleotide diphosphorylase [Vallitalea guaymasensis]|uniref:Probable nicotinate-nucleotide pyrophosphorylase [carboxylating] n=1 Tax=Vallitalea guaymasensis TaxID=1185412 RepID=A0A8J8MFN7_9FIRM|nr:carboxylating nicotinate-nucleotide diphosphorylase [Vallitalea guaymasensis]QUH31745.1 carboxylating nicotinate-nucleotide diphosphorylase [Vallitalea guaymasensis]